MSPLDNTYFFVLKLNVILCSVSTSQQMFTFSKWSTKTIKKVWNIYSFKSDGASASEVLGRQGYIQTENSSVQLLWTSKKMSPKMRKRKKQIVVVR